MSTLGWEVADWIAAHLPSPGSASEPFVLSSGELDTVLAWYEIDVAGTFVYRRGALQQAKGWGKSPLLAGVAIAEFVGPVLFDRWEDGQPKGRPWEAPWVQIAALSEAQADANVFTVVHDLLTANDGRAAAELGIDVGLGRMLLSHRPGRLEAVTSEAGSREGQRLTFGLLDESHLMVRSNGGAKLARTLRRNAAKVGGRTFECANAHEPGLGSVVEATVADFADGEPGILFVATRPSRLPEPTMSDDELRVLIGEVYASAPWVNQARILAEIRDSATPWDEAARFYLNSPFSGSDVLVDPARWAALARPGDVANGARVAIGFDGSHSHDGTAVVLCDEAGHLSLELLIERAPSDPPGWTVPRRDVHDVIADLFGRFEVTRLLADPWGWRDELDAWTEEYGEARVLAFPTNSVRRFGPAVDRFRTALAEGRITHDADPDLSRHLANARLVRGPGRAADAGHALFTVEKAGPGRFVDAAVAAFNAYQAMATAPAAVAPRVPLIAWA